MLPLWSRLHVAGKALQEGLKHAWDESPVHVALQDKSVMDIILGEARWQA